ncbi:MAG: radical SAM protein [Victivallales bacterium]
MVNIMRTTQSYCNGCRQNHHAYYERSGNTVKFIIDCPEKRKDTLISSDADLFEQVGSRGYAECGSAPFRPGRTFNLMEITSKCNLSCPVCYADAGKDGNSFLSLDKAIALAEMIRREGGRLVTLTGGEPSIHPEIISIVQGMKKLGLRPLMASNGLRLAEDKTFAHDLKMAGLEKVQLQFDTLEAQTSMKMRGENLVELKFKAAENIIGEGLRLGLVACVCSENLGECRNIMKYAAGLAPMLNTIMFQAYLPVGRHPAGLGTVTREDIVKALVGADEKLDVSTGDFFPMPQYQPWGLAVHPHCSSYVFLGCCKGRGEAVNRKFDVEGFCRDLHSSSLHKSNFISRTVFPLFRLMRRTRLGGHLSALRQMRGFISGKGGESVIAVAAGSYMTPEIRDEERIGRCQSFTVTEKGLVRVCERVCSNDTCPKSI